MAMGMEPTTTAIVTAVAVTAIAALVPADFAADQSAKSWVPAKWRRYRLKLAALQIVATLIVALAAQGIGWAPTRDAGIWNAVAYGVSWSIAAVAVLRAEVTGFHIEAATPGFSVLRTFSSWFGSTLSEAIKETVRATYKDADLPALRSAANRAMARMELPQPDGKPTPAQMSYGAQIESYKATDGSDPELCRELILTIVVKHHLTRL